MTRLTEKERVALDLMALARVDEPRTDDGILYGRGTFYDSEICVVFVNHRTAHSLRRKGWITFGQYDPEWGTSLTLAEEIRR